MGPQNLANSGVFCIMNDVCYILYSSSLDKFYIGFTQEPLESRLKKHRQGFYNRSFTKITTDWDVYYFIVCECTAQALSIEKHIKKMKSRTYLENLKKYSEISIKLKQKYTCT